MFANSIYSLGKMSTCSYRLESTILNVRLADGLKPGSTDTKDDLNLRRKGRN